MRKPKVFRRPKPGVRLDAQVAKILGWTNIRIVNDKFAGGIPPKHYGDHLERALYGYSTNDNHAMEILNHLRNSGQFCCITVSSDYNFCWDLSLTISDLEGLLQGNERLHEPAVKLTTESLAYGLSLLLVYGLKEHRKYARGLKKQRSTRGRRPGRKVWRGAAPGAGKSTTRISRRSER